MPPLLGIQDLSKSYGAKLLFKNLSFGIESGERIGLIGPNGAGKTTLLKILAGQAQPDDGVLSYQKGLRIGFLEQVPLFGSAITVQEAIREGLPPSLEDWEKEMRADEYIARFALDADTLISKLSGGWKKRVALARELVKQPDLLFLDEPTNHLDVESILWLEKFLATASFATLTITHDRLFLQRIANRILELDRRNVGGLLSVDGDYMTYLALKEQLMSAQEKQEVILKNTLRRETEWLRQGAKARTTKQQGRIQRAHALKEVVEDLSSRNQSRVSVIDFQKSTLPKKLLEAKGISKSYQGNTLFSNVDLLLSPGTRVALLGANGAGKSTFIRVLLGQESPDAGSVHRSEKLAVAYFEQNRDTLDPRVSLARTLCPSGDHVEYRGQPIHIKGYLDRFLFTSTQMELAVGKLSGGEQSRVLIAKLMLQPANLLILDEPTNDLDMATLNVLQDCLTDFEGAILLVTHDRYFLGQVANKILAFPPSRFKNPETLVSFADLNQWESWFDEQDKNPSLSQKETIKSSPKKKQKLGYLEQREFDGLEKKIHEAENQYADLQKESELPQHATNAVYLLELMNRMEALKKEIDQMYHRWEELHSKQGQE